MNVCRNETHPFVVQIAWLALLVPTLSACGPAEPPPAARFIRQIPWAEKGVWLKADTHVHTRFSDGGVDLGAVVQRAAKNGCHVLAITDHADSELTATSDEYFAALEEARRAHPELILLAGLEWNVPPWEGREHATLLVPADAPERQTLREFQVRFDDWKRTDRDPDLALQALDWLSQQKASDAGPPVVIYNHPCRQRDSADAFVEEFARWQQASSIAVGFEGGPGHQDSEPIGDYKQKLKTIDRWDPAAETGGAWDKLLARGLPVWGAVATSDFHHGEADQRDDYWPGEFSETWLYAPQPAAGAASSAADALAALRAGSFFGVHGQIARQVELRVSAPGLPREAMAGEAIHTSPGSKLHVTLHLETPLVDWQAEPNWIDQIELIYITAGVANVLVRPATSDMALSVSVEVPEGGVTLRARGRRKVLEGPDLMFYTNPIQVFTDAAAGAPKAKPLGVEPAVVLATNSAGHSADQPPVAFEAASSDSRQVPAWISLGFVVAASLLTSLMDRWHLEIRRRFTALGTEPAAGPQLQAIPRGWRRYFFALLVGFVFLAVYGSLVPLRPTAMDWATAVARFQEILQQPVSLASRTDFATNVLLFLPIGFLATGLVLGSRPGDWRRSLGIILAVVACAALSLAIEFAQLWVADRTPSQNDVVAETLGALIGATAWLFLGPVLITWLSRVMNASRPRQRVEHLLEAYVALVVLYMFMPLDLTLRPAELYDKFQDGRINLIPLADIAADPTGAIQLAGDLLLLVPLGMLAALWRWPVWERVRPLVPSLVAGLVVVATIEAAQLLVMSRYSSTTDLITGGLGVLVGWLIADWLVRSNASRTSPIGLHKQHVSLLVLVTAAYALVVAALLCLPFDRWATSAEASERLHQLFTRPPLTSLYWGSELNAVSQMLRKTLLGGPLGALLALTIWSWRPTTFRSPGLVLIAVLATACLGIAIEVLQVWLLPHVPDFTDAFLTTLGAAIGTLAIARILEKKRTAAPGPVARLLV